MPSAFVETTVQHLRVLGTFFQECQGHPFPLLGHRGGEANQRLRHGHGGDRGHRHVDDHGVDLRRGDVWVRQNLLRVHRGHGEFHACRLGGTGLCLYPGLCGRPDPESCSHGPYDVHHHASDVRGPPGIHGRRGLNKKEEK